MSHSIATRTGDDGSTSLLFGRRVPKDHPQIEAVGAFDELNVALGATKPLLPDSPRGRELRALVTSTQKSLIALMGELACDPAADARYAASQLEKFTPTDLQPIDDAIAALEARSLTFEGWATPGANALSSAFEVARVTARRAERRLLALPSVGRSVRPELHQFANRLSDLLWLLAREAETS